MSRGPLRPRAEATDGMCRDKVNIVRSPTGAPSGPATRVSFVGVGGRTVDVDVPADTYILLAAEKAGVDLPATCRGGICGACVGKVVKGAVDQSDIADLSFVLDEEQQSSGMALLCMSRPLGAAVTIEAQCDWGNASMSSWKGATFYSGEPVSLFAEGVYRPGTVAAEKQKPAA